MRTQMSYIMIMAIVLSLFCFAGISRAQETAEKGEVTSIIKEIRGEVSYIGPKFISIIYKKDEERGGEYEIMLYLAKDIKVKHKKSLKEINLGDKVKVEYAEIVEITEQVKKSERIAQVVTFIGPKVEGLRSD